MTNEQVLAQLQTRGFESGGFGSPIRHARWKLDSITGSMVQRGTMPIARLEVNYNFSGVEILPMPDGSPGSTEPYPWPIAQINLLHSNRDKSGMGILGKSIDTIINAGVDGNAPQTAVKNQDFLIGKVQEWMITPGHMMWNRDENKETPRECWEVVHIEGVGGTPHSGAAATESAGTPKSATKPEITPTQQAINLLDGKTQQEWNAIVFLDPFIKADTSDLKTNIISGSFVTSLETAGIITKDDNGIFHVKPAVLEG